MAAGSVGLAVDLDERQIASWMHLVGYFAIMAYLLGAGIHSQRVGLGEATSSGQLMDHSQAMRSYLVSILANVGITYYCWVGVHWRGGTMATLTGGRWRSWKDVAVDIAIAVPFCIVWQATAHWVGLLLGPSEARSLASMLPQSGLEVALWIAVSVTAGFCEEIQSRGYLQQQLRALSGSVMAAVVGQALVFGLVHSYQGWKKVIVIAVLGVLYGTLAVWRRDLRANMISHGWLDVWNGWLQQVVWR
jgi:membrane protease YdiL (CAAX protease family)